MRFLFVLMALNFHAFAWADYNSDACAQVAGTNAIHWKDILGNYNFCEEIEYLDVTKEQDATFTLTNAGTSNGNTCIANFAYSFMVAADGLSASGQDTVIGNEVAMELTREPHQQCFVGRWQTDSEIWLGHFSASMFGIRASATPVPSLGLWQLGLLGGLMSLAVWARRRHSKI